MKIGLIIYGSLDTLSGGYLYDRQLVAFLRAMRCHVDILSLPWRTYPSHLTDNLRLTWARQIAAAHYDLLLQDELNHPSLFLLNTLLRQLCTCPIISIVHHLRSSEDHPAKFMPIYRAVERHYLRSVDGFIYNSNTTRQIVQQQLHAIKPHVIAYPAADHRQPPSHAPVVEAISQRLHASKPLQLLFVGNLMARKGLHTLLNALARLTTQDWHLHSVGSEQVDPAYSAAMHHRSNTLSLNSHITWHGRVTDSELAHRYAASDLLVLPSYEGFGIVYLEAMAYGLPVIATNVGAAPEIVNPAINGYLVPPIDDQQIANYIELLHGNPVHLATLAYHARLRYETHPTWSQSMHIAYEWLRETARSIPAN